MKTDYDEEEARRISGIIEERTMPGSERVIIGWQAYLGEMLTRMRDYLAPGRLVTFERMQPEEKRFFESIHARTEIPEDVTAIFMPHSVMMQMMAAHPDATGQETLRRPTDAGVVLAARTEDHHVVMNAVFALPPYTPAIDIYRSGTLLAGYIYHTIDECVDNLSKIMSTHLTQKA